MKEKYFYIAYSGFKYSEIPTSSDIPNEAMQMLGAKNNKIPVPMKGYDVIKSDNGMFIPSLFCEMIKRNSGVENCVIDFVKEITKDEFDADVSFTQELSKPPKVSNAVMDELDELINAAENGKLNINIKPDSDKNDDEFGGLFKKPKGWN